METKRGSGPGRQGKRRQFTDEFKAGAVRLVLDTWQLRHGIVSPKYKGKRGHPVALPLELRDEIRATPTTATLHEVIKKHLDLRFDVEVDDAGVLRDVDVPDDLARQPS